MSSWLQPDYQFTHYTDITPQWLQAHNIKFILSDLDSTLAPHNEREGQEFSMWYKDIEAAGTGLIIVSNNSQARIQPLLDDYHLVGLARCAKPGTKRIMDALFLKGLSFETTLFLGDQLFTDILCGKRLGIRTALVFPIPGHDPFQIRCKRKVEAWIKSSWTTQSIKER